MSDHTFRRYAAIFFTSMASWLIAFWFFTLLFDLWKPITKVIEPVDPPFEVCKESLAVKPGGSVCYVIHYRKFKDIPGDISKQLIVKPKDGSLEVYIPLSDTAGHLPLGDINKKAYANIPEWTPEGTGVLKLSATYRIGGKEIPPVVAYTKEFEIRKQ